MSISVFIADDHSVVREGLKVMLETQTDIKVVGTAANGKEAVEQIALLHPDIAVLDIAMPELNGIEATDQILKCSPSTRVLILSMHANSEHVYTALKAGASGYVLKESAVGETIKAIREIYLGRRYLCSRIQETVFDDYILQEKGIDQKSPIERLSDRERQVLQLVVEGRTSADIAGILDLSAKTVETYRSRLMQKLGVEDIAGLVKFALRHGLMKLE
ncbi:MAG: response regulator transcription factor [Candidatus Dadabacteria bacterium]|nr:MAG: response regulator transcription factor [Candidatus Dadabacteria bacterium]